MNEHIMMIHGMWCGDWVWGNYKSYFESKGYHCITPALRHHYKSPGVISQDHIGTTSLLDYVEDLENEIYKLDQKPILMGHSMGGLLAQILGSRGLAKALVLLTPAAPSGIVALKMSVIKSFWSSMTTPAFWRKPMFPTFGEAVYSMLQLLSAEEQKDVYERLVPESGLAGFELGFWLLDRNHASRVGKGRINCPTLIIAGGQDKITPPSVVRRVAEKYNPVATFKEFANHAHWVIGENGWNEIAEYSENWLDQVLTKMPMQQDPTAVYTFRQTDKMKKAVSVFKEKLFPAKQIDRRVCRRIEISAGIDANIPYSRNAQYYELGRSVNISRGGLYVDTDLPLNEGAYVNLNLNINESERPIWAQGRVIRSSDKGIALHFTHAETERLNRVLPT